MTYFTCALHAHSVPGIAAALRTYPSRAKAAANRDHEFYGRSGRFVANVGQTMKAGLSPTLARYASWIGVGNVRLDNRAEISSWSVGHRVDGSDLEVLLRALAAHGTRCIPKLLGDFAFVAWNTESGDLLAARDAFGVRPLYQVELHDGLAFSSYASLICQDTTRYSLEFIADYLVSGNDPVEHSPFSGVRAIPCGTMLIFHNGKVQEIEYWSPFKCIGMRRTPTDDDVATFRSLFTTSVSLRLSQPEETWAQLSGGLDSSSVVSVAESLNGSDRHRLGGTVTFTDSSGGGDEHEYVNAVVSRYGLRNIQFRDHWMWEDDGEPPPLTETPTINYPFYARDRKACKTIIASGGRVVLTGQGGDNYLSCLPYHVADLAASRRIRESLQELTRWAITTRMSWWRLGFRYGLLPLLPKPLRRTWLGRELRMPPWITTRFAKTFDIANRPAVLRSLDGPMGNKFGWAIAHQTSHYGRYGHVNLFDDTFELRHPFLYRPLVEFCLELPPQRISRPLNQKWILRAALHDVLPEKVRHRTGKGIGDSRIAWSFERERQCVDALVKDPLLAQLGCIEPKQLKMALASIRSGKTASLGRLIATLSLETWLRVRSGCWPIRESASYRAFQPVSTSRTTTNGGNHEHQEDLHDPAAR